MRFDMPYPMQESLGKTLRTAREAAGLSVDDAVYRARLPRSVVEALEADDLGYFTSPLYARSFLKQYGEYVGADVSPWIDDLVPTALIDPESVESFLDLSDAEVAPPARMKEKSESPGGGGGNAMAAVWLIIITGGLVWAGMGYFNRLDERMSAKQQPLPPPVTAKEEPPPEVPAEKPVAIVGPDAPKRAIIVNLPEEE